MPMRGLPKIPPTSKAVESPPAFKERHFLFKKYDIGYSDVIFVKKTAVPVVLCSPVLPPSREEATCT
jgi:hypothetical protein